MLNRRKILSCVPFFFLLELIYRKRSTFALEAKTLSFANRVFFQPEMVQVCLV